MSDEHLPDLFASVSNMPLLDDIVIQKEILAKFRLKLV